MLEDKSLYTVKQSTLVSSTIDRQMTRATSEDKQMRRCTIDNEMYTENYGDDIKYS